jgi:hypothetical protein
MLACLGDNDTDLLGRCCSEGMDYPPCERCGKKGHRADLCLAAMLQRIEELEGKDVGGQCYGRA